jgi:spore coat polysaccharide biosynthesis protein SpsF
MYPTVCVKVIAIIQARVGSTRLPGKVMYPLNGRHVLEHVVARTESATLIDEVIVATSTEQQDDVIADRISHFVTDVFRGSESDVLGRMYDAARAADADVIVRITGDCPLIDPETIDAVVQPIQDGATQYAANIFERTFPRGLDVEAFTFKSFERVSNEATEPHHREHVTPYYREELGRFKTASITSDAVFDDSQFQDRDDLRLTLDEAADYEVLHRIYDRVPFDDILPTRNAIHYTDENELMELNASVEQKSH